MSAGPQGRGVAERAIPGTVLDDQAPGLARSYAEAFVNAAGDDAGPVVEELEEFVEDVLRDQPEFASLMNSPTFAAVERDRVLVRLLEGRAHETTLRFLRVLNRHGRFSHLEAISRAARTLLDRKQNRRRVAVRSAVPLDEAQQSSLRDRLAAMIGATPVIRLEVDPSLIGGLVVQVGDEVYDASVRTRLERLRARLIERKTHEIQSRRDHFSYPA